jgi:hypothetical protein
LLLKKQCVRQQIYAYNITKFNLVNNKPFRSIRSAAKVLPILANTLSKKLDTPLQCCTHLKVITIIVNRKIKNQNKNKIRLIKFSR